MYRWLLISFATLMLGTLPAAAQEAAEALNEKGIEQAKGGEHAAALETFNQVIQMAPQLAKAYNNRGNTLRQLGRLEEASDDYTKAQELDRQYCDPYYNRAVLRYFDQGNINGAYDDYTSTMSCDPTWADAAFARGYINGFELGVSSRQQSVFDFTRAITLYEKQGNHQQAQEARNLRAQVCQAHKDYGYTLDGCFN